METLLTNKTVSITELRNPKKVIEEAGDDSVAILNRNTVVGYFVPASRVGKKEFRYADSNEVLRVLKESKNDNAEVLEYLRDK